MRLLLLLAAVPGLIPLAAVPALIPIAGGSCVMGDPAGEPDESPPHRVSLPPFSLDRDEVTAADYARCVAAGRCQSPRQAPASPDAAVTWVSWNDAATFCHFAGKRLPTEAEWERAATGGEGRAFPWGDAPDCARANFGNYRGEGRCPKNPGRPVAPGRFPGGTSKEGARDLAGNVWEWVADRYDARYYARSPSRNPQGPSRGDRHVVRGGACCSMFGLPRAKNRLAFPPDYTDEDIGFRCAL